MEVAMKNTQNMLSKIATNDGHGENSPYFDGWKAYDANPFHSQHNPAGVIQMGLAENMVYIHILMHLITPDWKFRISSYWSVCLFFSFVLIWSKNGFKRTRLLQFVPHRELRISKRLPFFKTTMACRSSETPLLISWTEFEETVWHLTLTALWWAVAPPELMKRWLSV